MQKIQLISALNYDILSRLILFIIATEAVIPVVFGNWGKAAAAEANCPYDIVALNIITTKNRTAVLIISL